MQFRSYFDTLFSNYLLFPFISTSIKENLLSSSIIGY